MWADTEGDSAEMAACELARRIPDAEWHRLSVGDGFSVVEMAHSVAEKDPGRKHVFRSDLECIDQYAEGGCGVVVTDPIRDLAAMCRDLERARDTLWKHIRELSGYDLDTPPEAAVSGD